MERNNEKIICSNEHEVHKNAKKYCFKCQRFLCSDCLVEFDLEHLRDNSIISLDDYFNKFKDRIIEIHRSIHANKQVIVPFQKSVMGLVDSKVDQILNKMDNFTNTLTQELFNYNNSLRTRMSRFKEQFLTELKERSDLFKYIDNDFDVMLQELEKISKSWDVNLRSDRNKIINEVNNLYSQPEHDIKQAVENFGTNRDRITPITSEKQSELERILSELRLDERLANIKEIIHITINNNPSSNRHHIITPFNHIIPPVNSIIPPVNPINPPVNHIILPVNPINPPVNPIALIVHTVNPFPNPQPNPININRNEIKSVELGIVRDLNNPINEFTDRSNSIVPGIDFKYIIGIKSNSSTIYVYWNKKIHEVNITSRHLEGLKSNPRNSSHLPFKNSRIANIGNFAILTGGSNDIHAESKECFQITPTVENNTLKITLTDFPSMNNARERHNTIYLQNFNCILVCSSFQRTVSTEICYLSDRNWINLKDMNSRRANSTLTLVNDRWLFCISGYIVDLELGSGIYSNSYEVLDMREIDSGWKEYNFANEFQILKMSAMGCINLNRNDFILIGGFNGQRYMDTSYHVTAEDGKLARINRVDNTLDAGVIFQNASFMRSGRSYINYDYTKVCELTLLR
jgi:hypothetical protein